MAYGSRVPFVPLALSGGVSVGIGALAGTDAKAGRNQMTKQHAFWAALGALGAGIGAQVAGVLSPDTAEPLAFAGLNAIANQAGFKLATQNAALPSPYPTTIPSYGGAPRMAMPAYAGGGHAPLLRQPMTGTL